MFSVTHTVIGHPIMTVLTAENAQYVRMKLAESRLQIASTVNGQKQLLPSVKKTVKRLVPAQIAVMLIQQLLICSDIKTKTKTTYVTMMAVRFTRVHTKTQITTTIANTAVMKQSVNV